MVVSAEDDLCCLAAFCIDGVFLITVVRVEIEDEEEACPLVGEDLIGLMFLPNILIVAGNYFVLPIQPHHFLVKVEKVLVAKVLSIQQVPSSPAVLIAPVIAFSWKIHPLRVSEFIPHETHIAITTQTHSN